MTYEELAAAHKHCFKNKEEILASSTLGCFYCLSIYDKFIICNAKWVDNNKTLVCPLCSIDSVIGDKSGYPITDEFLKQMHYRYFTPIKNRKQYKSVSEMLHSMADDEYSKRFAEEFDIYQKKWSTRFRKWRFVKWLFIKIWFKKLIGHK